MNRGVLPFKFKNTPGTEFVSELTALPAAPTAGNTALVSVDHGLTSAPTRIDAMLVCVTGDGSYVAGDVVRLIPFYPSYHSSSVYADAATVTLQIYNAALRLLTKTSGATFAIDHTRWQVRFFAWL